MQKKAEIKAEITEWNEEEIGVNCETDFENIDYADVVSIFSAIAIHISEYTDKSAEKFIEDVRSVIRTMGKDGLIEKQEKASAEIHYLCFATVEQASKFLADRNDIEVVTFKAEDYGRKVHLLFRFNERKEQ